MEKQTFKKIIVACLFLSLAGTLTACQSKGKSENEVSQSSKVSDPTKVSDKFLKEMVSDIKKGEKYTENPEHVDFFYDNARRGYIVVFRYHSEYDTGDSWYLVKKTTYEDLDLDIWSFTNNNKPFRVLDKNELE